MTLTRAVTVAAFGLAVVLVAVVEWIARRDDSKVPTLGDVCAFIMRYTVGKLPVGRIAVLGFWWWVGWHFFAR